jgi:diguanylate cyclase (GGDEF)-like protein
MLEFPPGEIDFLQQVLESVQSEFHKNVLCRLQEQTPYFLKPPAFEAFLTALDLLRQELNGILQAFYGRSAPSGPLVMDEKYASAIKCIVLAERRLVAARVEQGKESFTDPAVRRLIEQRLVCFDSLMGKSWFTNAIPLLIPKLADYLTIERAEETASIDLKARSYDEKFHILQAPWLFTKDLRYYRSRCEMRNVPLAVAYIDIDDFKAFNTNYGNPIVDLYLLPRFMRAIEGQLFCCGHGYRYGGDEYVVILPNSDAAKTVELFKSLRTKLASLEYQTIGERPTVSIGFCVIDPDCYLTEREIEEKAAKAKDYAKTHGKNCVATHRSAQLVEEELFVVVPAPPVAQHDA